MAWSVQDENLQMCENDYGLSLPITIEGTTLTEHDSTRMTFKTAKNGETIITKEFSQITQNAMSLVLTEAESELFPVGSYVYSLDWYQDGAFMCNIIPTALGATYSGVKGVTLPKSGGGTATFPWIEQ